MSNAPRVILASASPRRQELLRSLGFELDVIPSNYDEPEHPQLVPRDLAIVHARHKCRDVRERVSLEGAVLVAADTVVDVDGIAYNKPVNERDAKRMLRDLSGRTHIVHTALALAAR